MYFNIQFLSFVERKANSTMEHKKCKRHEKRDRPLVSTVDFKQVSHRNREFAFWSRFLKLI